ncbi:MAG: A/G-specific adenine glycosylase [Verrucomicrobiales bacterium]|nr:A/G-specific adenine glycosylase [Verrucomicrobiales bacterium]
MQPAKKSGISRRNPDIKTISQIVDALLDWFSTNARDLPWRRTRDPYAIWVSEIMLQQTQVKTVIPYWQRWMRALPDIVSLGNASSEIIHKLWEGLGYYTRVRNMQKAAQMILQTHTGKFPEKFDEVLALSGIGPYTAGAICSIAFNHPTAILDGNVIRVLCRLFCISENPRDKEANARLWALALMFVESAADEARHIANRCSHLNQSLMELGALVCTPRQPQCTICPVKKHCLAFRFNQVDCLPNLGKRTIATERRFLAFVVQDKNKFLIRQRPEGIVNGKLWEFPNHEIAVKEKNISKAAEPFEINVRSTPFCQIKHSITRYRITLEVFHAQIAPKVAFQFGQWRTVDEVKSLAFTSAHRKVLNALLGKAK